MIESAVYTAVIADAGLTAAIGSRLYPAVAPADADLPLAVYLGTGDRELLSVRGGVVLRGWAVHLDVFAAGYAAAKSAAAAIEAAFRALRGQAIGSGAYKVRSVRRETRDDSHLPPVHADERGTFSVGVDLVVWYGTTGG